MILLDTNVLIYAFDPDSSHSQWSKNAVADGVAHGGAAISAVSLAEICVGDDAPGSVGDRIRSWGVDILDVPVAAAEVGAEAYRRYLKRRSSQSGKEAPSMPLPDFFIGAHAHVMSWALATVDKRRFHTYFPSIHLKTP